ncbi:MAG: protease modulator HflC [Planctomycetes bacterium]|nr:protease modulator HflC [Planctomycetota bacterium]
MKNVSVLTLVALIIVVLGLFFVSFQVRETEIAIVTTFGKPTKSIDEPGLKFRYPAPIQSVYKFDSRNNLFKGIMEETTTRGGEPIIITSYVVWKIGDPLKFLESVRDKKGAEEHLRSLLRNTQNEVVGQFYFSEFVNADKSKIKFEKVEQMMADGLRPQAIADYGIDVQAVGIKQLGISDKVTQDVFARMSADRLRKTEETIAQGNAEATKIRTDAESKKTELLAIVEAEAKAIKGRGDAEAAKYYKLLEADEELAMFLRDIEALKNILKGKTTIVLGAETEPIKLLKGVPDIK